MDIKDTKKQFCKGCRTHRMVAMFINGGKQYKSCFKCRSRQAMKRKERKARKAIKNSSKPTALPKELQDIVLGYCRENHCEACPGGSFEFRRVWFPNSDEESHPATTILCTKCMRGIPFIGRCFTEELDTDSIDADIAWEREFDPALNSAGIRAIPRPTGADLFKAIFGR